MDTIYLIRHGQSVANAKKLKQNLNDYELSKKGIEQAKSIILDDKINKIYTSPMLRSKHTAEIIKQKYTADILEDDRLLEWKVFTEKDNYKLSKHNTKKINPYYLQYDLHEKYGEGESFYDIHTRLNDFLNDYILQSDEEVVVIVSHAGAINHLIYLLLFGYNQDTKAHYDLFLKLSHIKNCSVTKLVNTSEGYKMDYYNYARY